MRIRMSKGKLKNETAFQKQVQRSLSYSYIGKCSFKKNHGSMYSLKGAADIDGHIHGHYVALELKMLNGRPSSEQLAFCHTIVKTGGSFFWLVYEWQDGHFCYIIPGGMPFTYRMKKLWRKVGTVIVPVDPKNEEEGTVEVFDFSDLIKFIMAKDMTCK